MDFINTGGLYCINSNEEFNVYGNMNSESSVSLNIEMRPCQSTDSNECPFNKQETQKYLKDSRFVLFFNTERFLISKYDN